ncbi:MAG: hypothetical protein JY451_05175 [Erythrobacter sp.]|nr:MAG: hypothetical protein JY451_05175 [Erythrobacter sp.]
MAVGLAVATPIAAQADPGGGWSLDPFARLEAGVVLSQSEDRDDELIINGDGGYLRGQIGVELGNETTQLRLEADRIEVERFGSATGRSGYNRDRISASLTQELGEQWEVELALRAYDDLVSVESADTDERQTSILVQFEPEQAHRFRLRGTWRDREYDDGAGPGGASSTGDGLRVDADYRHRLGRYHYINFDLRTESIDSANPDRRYSRESASVSYTHPLTSDLRVRPAVELRQTRFGGRLTPAGEAREDSQIVPEVELLWWPGQWRIEAEAKYVFGDSNDPVRDRRGYRLSLSVGYAF